MTPFADTSFLFAFYFPRADSERALAKVEALQGGLRISSMVRLEFCQAVWFKVWLQTQGQQQLGLSETVAQNVLAAFELDLEQGLWTLGRPAWEEVLARAERLTLDHTARHGARTLDIVHIATAQVLGATEFLSFDLAQRAVAQSAGLLAEV